MDRERWGGRWDRWMVRKRRGRDGGGVERRVVNGYGGESDWERWNVRGQGLDKERFLES